MTTSNDYIRKSFVVKATEITEDNIQALAEHLGRVKYTEDEGKPYILFDDRKVPRMKYGHLGHFITEVDGRTMCYKPDVFDKVFILATDEMLDANDVLNGLNQDEDDEEEN